MLHFSRKLGSGFYFVKCTGLKDPKTFKVSHVGGFDFTLILPFTLPVVVSCLSDFVNFTYNFRLNWTQLVLLALLELIFEKGIKHYNI